MFSDNRMISVRQIQSLAILNMLGFLFVTLPVYSVNEFGGLGWFAAFCSAVVAAIYATFIVCISKFYEKMGFGLFLEKTVGRIIGSFILIGFYCKIIIGASLQLRIFSEVISYNLLLKTPLWVISLFLIIACYYCAKSGYEVRGRVAEILLFFVVVTTVIIFAFSLNGLEWRSVFANSFGRRGNFIEVIGYGFLLFNGLEVLLIAMPYVRKSKNASKDILNAILFLGVLIAIATIISTAYFGISKMKNVVWPIIDMMNSVDFKFSFAQRQDIVVMGLWISSMFGAVNSGLFFSSEVLGELFKMNGIGFFVSAMLIFVFSILPKNLDQIFYILNIYIKTAGVVYFIVIPILLAIVGYIAKKRGCVS